MTSDLMEAYQGVYVSSKEILRNKQKHLYINMLDLLTRTTKATVSSNRDLITDDYVKFWFMEIVPLIFDEDKSIQDNAISAIDTALQCIEPSRVQNLPEWPCIKKTIVESYSSRLHEMRQVSNSNWYRAWGLLIRILDNDILKGSSVINTFLSIVELGFRSTDYKTRAEAFICWKILVQIFAKHDEIFSPKRIKLICIPLKSSQSKTLETAVNKFKVWWYFLCKLNTKIEEYYDTAFEPFLLFCFGSPEKSQAIAQCKNYSIIKQMAIATLVEMLGPSTRESQCLLESTDLERPEGPLITTALMIKCGKTILYASFEAMLMIAEKNPERSKYFETLWRNLLEQISKTNKIELYLEYCNHVRRLTELETIKDEKVSQHYFSYIIKTIGTDKRFPFEHNGAVSDPKLLCQVISEITYLLRSNKIACSMEVAEAVINNIYDIGKLKSSNKYWEVQRLLIEAVMKEKELHLNLKLIIWEKLSGYLTEYLNERLFEFRIEQNATVVNNWLFWLIETCDTNDKITNSFLTTWNKLTIAASKAEGKCNFTRAVSVRFKDLLETKSQLQILPDILGSIIDSLEVDFDKSSKPKEVYELVNQLLLNVDIEGKRKDAVISALIRHINKLQETQILEAFDDFRTITATLISNSGTLTKHFFEEFKKTFSDKLKSNKAKEKKLLKEFKNIFKNASNPFVIIPTSWSFNPDKLTEHQKEKMKEKRTYIPALYNDISHDLSHSQDVIKPWTPNKIVIAKGKNSEEIVIENKITNGGEEIVKDINHEIIENGSAKVSLDKSTELINTSKENVDPSRDTSSKEDVNINLNKSITSDQSNEDSERKSNMPLPKDFEEMLKKNNIQVQGTKHLKKLLNVFKSMEIDTVEGNTFIKTEEKLRTRRSRQIDKNLTEGGKKSRRKKEGNETKVNTLRNRRIARKSLKFKCDENTKNTEILSNDQQNNKKHNNEESENKVHITEDDSTEEVIAASQEPSQSILMRKIFHNNNANSPKSKNQTLHLIKSPEVLGDNCGTSMEIIDLGSSSSKDHVKNMEAIPNKDLCPLPKNLALNGESETCANIANKEEPKRSPRNNKRKSENEEEKVHSLNDKAHPKESIYEFSEEPSEKPTMDADCKENTPKQSTSPRLFKSPSKMRLENKKEIVSESESTVEHIKASNKNLINAQDYDNKKTSSTSLPNAKLQDACCNVGIEKMQLATVTSGSITDCTEIQNGGQNIDSSSTNTLKICPIANSTNVELMEAETPLNDGFENNSQTDKNDNLTKQISPKKFVTLCNSSPSSPPDRKQTANNESPVVKPKLVTQLTGRGAKLINMIRNKKLEVGPKVPLNGLMTANIEKKISPQKSAHKQEIPQNSPEKGGQSAPKDLLIFSKVLPSPSASPSVSILKRKFRQDSLDDVESPANKRKRVSFHDPPVSVTKEYVKHVEEDRIATPNSKRCLIPEKVTTSQQQSSKQNFKRKSRVDSIIEIAKFAETSTPVAEVSKTDHCSLNMSSLKWNSVDNTEQGDDVNLTSSPSLYFPDETSIFNFIFEKYQFEDILEKYVASGKVFSSKSCRSIVKEVSTVMNEDPKLKTLVLEMLSEKHPKEFLDHAVQENLSAVVCDRLNTGSVIEYVSEKAKINTGMRSALLDQIPNILGDRQNTEKYEFLTSILKTQQLTQDQVVDCIDIIMERHKEYRQNQFDHP